MWCIKRGISQEGTGLYAEKQYSFFVRFLYRLELSKCYIAIGDKTIVITACER
jgi:hypothetical protein